MSWRLGGVLLLTALVYARSLWSGFVFDDRAWSGNPDVRSWSFIWKSFSRDAWWFMTPHQSPQSAYYRPLLDAWAAVNFHLFGPHPAGWHAMEIGLHLIAAWMVFRVASMLADNEWTGLLAAALFALLPANAESVAWPSAVCQPLYAIFALGAFEFYLRSFPSPAPGEGAGGRRSQMLAISLALFTGALLTYEAAVLLPLLIAVHAFLFSEIADLTPCPPAPSGKGERSSESSPLHLWGGVAAIAAAWPYALEAAAYLGVRFWVLGFVSRPNPANRMTAREVLFTIPGALINYIAELAIPWRSAPIRRLNIAASAAAPSFYAPLIGLAAIAIVGFLLLRRSPHRRLYLFCAAWFLVALAPMLNLGGLFPASVTGDRYLYFPSIGVCLLLADSVVSSAMTKRSSGSRSPFPKGEVGQGVGFLVIAIIALFALFDFSAQRFWRDDAALFSAYVRAAPQVEFYRYRLGVALGEQGDNAAARKELEAARRMDPADGWNLYNLALIDERLGDRPAAREAAAAALAKIGQPTAAALVRIALIADGAADPALANAALARAARIPGGAEAADFARAQLLYRHGDAKGAETALTKLIARDPNYEPAFSALGAMLSAAGRYAEALAMDRRAAALAPAAPLLHFPIAFVLHRMGRERAARRECAIALRAAPNEPKVRALMDEIQRASAARK
ncbi:MAG: tetratricopeptide repeat protein [Candidatus Binataceae bacterium]